MDVYKDCHYNLYNDMYNDIMIMFSLQCQNSGGQTEVRGVQLHRYRHRHESVGRVNPGLAITNLHWKNKHKKCFSRPDTKATYSVV